MLLTECDATISGSFLERKKKCKASVSSQTVCSALNAYAVDTSTRPLSACGSDPSGGEKWLESLLHSDPTDHDPVYT